MSEIREYAIMTPAGVVIDIVTTARVLSEICCPAPNRAVPLEKVTQSALEAYRYWWERP